MFIIKKNNKIFLSSIILIVILLSFQTTLALIVNKTIIGNNSVYVNDEVSFLINITNNDTVNYTNLTLKDIYNSAELNFTNSSLSPNSSSPGLLQWWFDLATGHHFSVYVNFTALTPSNTNNTAEVWNNLVKIGSDWKTITINSPNSPPYSFFLDKTTINNSVNINETAYFNIELMNNGSGNITAFLLFDHFNASELEYLSANVTPDTSNASNGEIFWEINLTNNQSFKVQVLFRAKTSGTIINHADFYDNTSVLITNASSSLIVNNTNNTNNNSGFPRPLRFINLSLPILNTSVDTNVSILIRINQTANQTMTYNFTPITPQDVTAWLNGSTDYNNVTLNYSETILFNMTIQSRVNGTFHPYLLAIEFSNASNNFSSTYDFNITLNVAPPPGPNSSDNNPPELIFNDTSGDTPVNSTLEVYTGWNDQSLAEQNLTCKLFINDTLKQTINSTNQFCNFTYNVTSNDEPWFLVIVQATDKYNNSANSSAMHVNVQSSNPPPPGGDGGFDIENSRLKHPYIFENQTLTFNFTLKRMAPPDNCLNYLKIILPVNYTYEGYNYTTATNYSFSINGSEMIWQATGPGFFCGEETTYFLLNISSNRTSYGSDYFEIIASNSQANSSLNLTVWFTTPMWFNGSVLFNKTPVSGANASIIVYGFGEESIVRIGTFSATTNDNGTFNITQIPSLGYFNAMLSGNNSNNSNNTNSSMMNTLFYKLRVLQYNDSEQKYAMKTSYPLPELPETEFVGLLGSMINLKPAMTFHIIVEGYDYASGPNNTNATCPGLSCEDPNWQPTFDWTQISFEYSLRDKLLGYDIMSNFGDSDSEIYAGVPRGRNYSLLVFSRSSFPLSIDFSGAEQVCNSTGANISQPGVQATCTIMNGTYFVNATITSSDNITAITGYINMTNVDEFFIMSYMFEGGNRIFEGMPFPANMANMNNYPPNSSLNDHYNKTTGAYTIYLPATQATSYIMLRTYVRNGSNYYMSSYKLYSQNMTFNTTQINFSMKPLINGVKRVLKTVDPTADWNETTIGNTTAVLFRLVDENNTLLSRENAFIEVKRSMGSSYYKQIVNAENGLFNISLLKGENIDKIIIYSQQRAPLSLSINSSLLAGTITTNDVSCYDGICNITLKPFEPFDPDNPNSTISGLISFYYSNETCNVPNPPASCAIMSNINLSDFNPLRAILLGDISLRITSGNISVYYANTDLIASGPPDAAFSQNYTGNNLNAAWKFGSKGPEIYDYVLLSMPYSSDLDNKTITVSIPIFYDNNFNVMWNASEDNLSSLIGTPYEDYLNNSYEAYINGSSVTCDENDNTLASGLCFKDTTHRTLWIRIPHFTGVGPLVSGSGGTVQIVLTKTTINNPVINGSTASFRINVTNNGTGSALNYKIIDYYDTSFLSFNNASMSYSEINTSNGTITWTVSISSNQSIIIMVNFTTKNPGTTTNIVKVFNSTMGLQTSDSSNLTIQDNTNPLLSIISPDNNSYSNSANTTFVFNISDPYDNSFNCSLYINGTLNKSETKTSGTRNISLALEEGTYSWHITCRDNAGNSNTSAERILIIDTTSPVTNASITSGTSGWNGWYVSNVIVNFSVVEDHNYTIQYTLNNTWNNLSGNTLTIANEGNNTLWYRSVDSAGNTENNKSLAILIDKTSPIIALFNTNPGNETTTNNNVTITARIQESNELVYSFYVDGAFVENRTYNNNQTSIFNWTNSSNYANQNVTFLIIAYDKAGHSVNSSYYWVYFENLTGFTVSLTTPANNSYLNNSNVNLVYHAGASANINNCTLRLYYENGTLLYNTTNSSINSNSTTQTVTYNNLTDNTYYWNATCNAGISNSIATSETWKFTIDTINPEVMLSEQGFGSSNGLNGYNTSNIQVTISVNDNNTNASSIQYKKGTGSWTQYTTPFNITKSLTLYYRASDYAGHTTTHSKSYLIDKYAPVTSIIISGNSTNGYYKGVVTITLSAEEEEVYGRSGVNKTYYKINNASWQTYSSSFNISGDGTYNVSYRSDDNAGNNESIRVETIIIDSTAPDINVTSPANNSKLSGEQTIVVETNSSDALSVAWYLNDSLRETNYNNTNNQFNFTWNTALENDGLTKHTFIITDEAGNTRTIIVYYYVDNTKPTISVDKPVSLERKNSTPIIINGTISESSNFVMIKINNGSWQNASINGTRWNYTATTGFIQGSNNILVSATDLVGLQSTIQRTFLFDNIAPEISSISVSPNPANNRTNNFTIRVEVNDNNSLTTVTARIIGGSSTTLRGTGSVFEGTINNNLTADGDYTLIISATDIFGNTIINNNNNITINNSKPIISLSEINNTIVRSGRRIIISAYNADYSSYNVSVNNSVNVSTTQFTNSTTYNVPAIEGANITIIVFANTSSGVNNTKLYTFRVDANNPSLTINTLSTYTNNNYVTVSGQASDNNLEEVIINNELISTTINGNFTYNVSLLDGNNTINITAIDSSGRKTTIIRYVFKDSSAPTTTYTLSGTSGWNNWYKSAVLVTLSSSDGSYSSGTITQYYNGTEFINTTTINITSNGEHTITFRSIDNAGNVEDNNTILIRIDSQAPIITLNLTSSPSQPEVNIDSITLSLNSSDAINGTITITDPDGNSNNYSLFKNENEFKLNLNPLSQIGLYQVSATIYDAAGNSATSNYNLSVVEKTSVSIDGEANDTISINKVDSVNSSLELELNNSVNGGEINITLSLHTPTNSSLNNSIKYLRFSDDNNINSSIEWVTIKVYYSDDEILGLDESELSIYWFNESSGSWVELNSSLGFVNSTGVNTSANYVWAKVSHFSDYAASSDRVTCTNNQAVPSTGCYLGSTLYTSGYICDGAHQSSACSSDEEEESSSSETSNTNYYPITQQQSTNNNKTNNTNNTDSSSNNTSTSDSGNSESQANEESNENPVVAGTNDDLNETSQSRDEETSSSNWWLWIVIILIIISLLLISWKHHDMIYHREERNE